MKNAKYKVMNGVLYPSFIILHFLRPANLAHNVKIEISGHKVAMGIINHLAAGGIQFGGKLQQHIAALDFKHLGHFSGSIAGGNIGAAYS